MPSVAVVLPTEQLGGHEFMLMEWLSVATESGLCTTIHCRENPELSTLARKYGLNLELVGYLAGGKRGRLRKIFRRMHNFRKTLELALRLPPNAIVLLAPGVMQAGLSHVVAALLARKRVVRYVPMAHGAGVMQLRFARLRDLLTSIISSRVSLWITISEEQGRRLVDYWRVRAPVRVVPNRLRALAAAPRTPLDHSVAPGKLAVLYAGRFVESHKGLDWLCEVLATQPEWTKFVTFTFQGRGPFRERLIAVSRSLGEERVRILPWGDVAEALRSTDVLLLTSRFEGMPLVAIEAIWAGIAVVATTESGLEGIIPKTCQFAFGDVDGFRDALHWIGDSEHRVAAVRYALHNLTALLDPVRYRDAVRTVVRDMNQLAFDL